MLLSQPLEAPRVAALLGGQVRCGLEMKPELSESKEVRK